MAKNKYTIVFENENYIAVDKPSGLLTIPDREQSEKSLKEYLIEKYGQIFTIHRLDKDTSGLLLFAKNEDTHKFFSRVFEDRNIQKFYIGVVLGQPDPAQGEIEASIGEHPLHKGLMNVHRNGKAAHTSYEVLDGNKNLSLVRFQLHTGRTHQIRVHAKEIGHPLAADPLYGDGKSIYLSTYKKKFKLSKHDEEERPLINRLALHSYQLIFTDNSGNAQNLQTAVPKNFTVLLKQLHKL